MKPEDIVRSGPISTYARKESQKNFRGCWRHSENPLLWPESNPIRRSPITAAVLPGM